MPQPYFSGDYREYIHTIDEEIQEQLTAISILRKKRNQAVPIGQLHSETLLSIFQFASSNYTGKCPIQPQLTLTWISSPWRELVLNHSQFWSTITYTNPPDLIDAAFLRSRPTMVMVDMEIQEKEKESNISHILNNLPRIGSLRITTASHSRYHHNHVILKSLPEWTTKTNSLTTLVLSYVCLPDGIFGGDGSSLQSIELTHCQFTWESMPTFPALSSFKVSNPKEKLTVGDAVELLGVMPNLSVLHLEVVLKLPEVVIDERSFRMDVVTTDPDSDGPSPSLLSDGDDEESRMEDGTNSIPTPLKFQELEEFRLVEQGVACDLLSSFLDRLLLPDVPDFTLVSKGDTDYHSILQSIVNSRSFDDSLPDIESFGIKTTDTSFDLSFVEEEGGKTSLTFEYLPDTLDTFLEGLKLLGFTDEFPLNVELLDKNNSKRYEDKELVDFFDTLSKLPVHSLILHCHQTIPFMKFVEKVVDRATNLWVRGANCRPGHSRCKPLNGRTGPEEPMPFCHLTDLCFWYSFTKGGSNSKDWKTLIKWLTKYREGKRLETLTLERTAHPPEEAILDKLRAAVDDVVMTLW